MKFFDIILESRIEDFKQKFRNKFSDEQLTRIINNVPQKFLAWVGKNLDSIGFNDRLQEVSRYLREFEKISSNLPKTDINSYKSIQELWQALSDYTNKPKRDFPKVEGGNVVYDDGRFFVVNPQTHQSSCYYGRGTKWCTTASSDFHFNEYNKDGKLFYILDRTKSTDDPSYKIALLKKFDGGETFHTAQNETINLGEIVGSELYDKIMSEVTQYMEQEYSEQLNIFREREREKKERERLEQLRIARRRRQINEEADERRAEGEWELGPDCPEEGLKAHALLFWLADNNDVDVKTNEDLIEIENIKNKILELNSQYENSENVETDILDEISDLEDSLDELERKVDVYNIVPVGEHYEMTQFEVINADLDDRRYAVGTEEETHDSCYDYVKGLIDDIGYEGFNHNFAQQFLDEEKIKDYAEDLYSQDVNDNPEAYLDDEDRLLSSKQEGQIEDIGVKIMAAKTEIQRLESLLEDSEDGWEIQEKIDEIEEYIDELENEIEEIKEEPDGDYDENKISEKIDEIVSDAVSDPLGFLKNYGYEWDQFIDEEEFIEGVIDEDGYGHTLNGYDGNADEVKIQNQDFWVMRID